MTTAICKRLSGKGPIEMKRFTLILVFAIFANMAVLHSNVASAQEVLLEGPLAGAPAVRKLIQYRKLRFGIAPYFNYTLNNHYVHNFLVGAHLEFNFTDWFGLGINAQYAFNASTKLTKHVASSVDIGGEPTTNGYSNWPSYTGARHFEDQVALIKGQYVAQLNFVPFRGKVAFFQRLFTAVDLSIFVGAGIVHINEREDCYSAVDANGEPYGGTCGNPTSASFDVKRVSRIAPAPTAGLAFNFYANDWISVNIELRFTPFSWNAGGTDESGQAASQWVLVPSGETYKWEYTPSNQEGDYPDGKINKDDRQWTPNASIGIGVGFYFPTKTSVTR